MKTLCPKPGKGGKIHPSPPGGDIDPTAAALRMLPAAILALTAALRPEDQQVLAYLVTRSLQGGAAPHLEQPPVRGRRLRAHPPAMGCGCFDCYTSFWSRWDCSPDRELIHDAIDAFEDHLAAAESSSSAASTPPPFSKRRDKGKRRAPPTPPPPPMPPKSPEPQAEKVQEPTPALASPPPPPPPPAPAVSTVESDEEKVPEDSPEAEAVENAEGEGKEEERKRGWADVMGMLNPRLWGIWSPAVESAT